MLEILGQIVGRALGRELTLIWAKIWQTLRRTLLTFGRQKFNIKGCINFVNTWAELWPIFLQNFGQKTNGNLGRNLADTGLQFCSFQTKKNVNAEANSNLNEHN
jgi:hypothetical protein